MSSANRLHLGVLIYSAAHFVVDFACALLLFSRIQSTPQWYLWVLLYNFCAFALQMPIGLLADRWNHNRWIASSGCLLVALAWAAAAFPLAAVLLAGVGNAMFHVGGGIEILNISTEKSGLLGVFVSPGAFGIFFGTVLGRGSGLPAPLILAALLGAALLILLPGLRSAFPGNQALSLRPGPAYGAGGAALCLFLVVCLRSYVGTILHFPWKSAGGWAVLLTCATVLGKAAGGFAADKIGPLRLASFSLGFGALLFGFSAAPLPGVFAVFFFNMTMPVTLWAMARIFPGAKGFSFGLLTFGLFLGFLPHHLGSGTGDFLIWPLIAASLASLLLIRLGLRQERA